MGVDLEEFIVSENAFQVMGQLKKMGCLTKEDMSHAMTLDRQEWIKFMRLKAGLEPNEAN